MFSGYEASSSSLEDDDERIGVVEVKMEKGKRHVKRPSRCKGVLADTRRQQGCAEPHLRGVPPGSRRNAATASLSCGSCGGKTTSIIVVG